MSKHTDELLDLLVYHFEGTREGNPSDYTEEGQDAYHLTGVMQDFERGEIDLPELLAHFNAYAPGFDVKHWLNGKVQEGVYRL